MKKIVNYTGHTVHLLVDGEPKTLNPLGKAHLVFNETSEDSEVGIPIKSWEVNGVRGLPDEDENVLVLVPGTVKQACYDRDDLAVPDSKNSVMIGGQRHSSAIFHLVPPTYED